MDRRGLSRLASCLPVIFVAATALFTLWLKADANPLGANSSGFASYDSPVTLQNGDAYNTYQVACSSVVVSTNAVTVLTSSNDALGLAWTGSANASRSRPRLRRRTITNISNFWVYIGSNSATGLIGTSSTKGGFAIGPSTVASSVFETYNSSDFYCNQEGAGINGTGKVTVLEEYNTIP